MSKLTVVPYFQKRFIVKRKWFRVLVAVFFGFLIHIIFKKNEHLRWKFKLGYDQ